MIDQEHRTASGRKRRRPVRVDVDDVLGALTPACSSETEAWERIRRLLVERIGESRFDIWLGRAELVGVDGDGALVIDVPNETHGWVADRFGGVLSACSEAAGSRLRLTTKVENAAIQAIANDLSSSDARVEPAVAELSLVESPREPIPYRSNNHQERQVS